MNSSPFYAWFCYIKFTNFTILVGVFVTVIFSSLLPELQVRIKRTYSPKTNKSEPPIDIKLHAAFKRYARHEYIRKIKKDGALVTGLEHHFSFSFLSSREYFAIKLCC